jgi:hypothetical protein
MSYAASRVQLGNLPSYRIGEQSYDPDKLGLGPLMHQSSGVGVDDNWAGPLPVGVGRIMDITGNQPACFPWAMQWSNSLTSKIDWVFLADVSAGATTRRIHTFRYDRLTGEVTYGGYVTVTFPTSTSHSIRAFRMTYDKHTAGTVSVSDTSVSGAGTSWQTDRACWGNRIGFGSTDPAQIDTWYEISSIGSDNVITLTTSAGTIAAGTPYVIEDLRAIILTTNNTATNGGLFVVKGLRVENFVITGTTIPAATVVDNIRACYWLKSAATVTETVGNGLGLQDRTSFQSHMAWVGSGTTTNALYKFNLRAALTLSSGADTTAFQFSTAVSATLVGTASQANNGRVANTNHGPGAGEDCYYFTTNARIYRSKPLSSISAGDTTWLSAGDAMQEIPPGGVYTYNAPQGMYSIEYSAVMDTFVILQNPATEARLYLTQYRSDGGQIDRVFGVNARQYNQASADSTITPMLSLNDDDFLGWIEGGLLYLVQMGNAAYVNIMYILPLAADWEYAATTNNRLILPRLDVSAVNKFVQAFCQEDLCLGGDTGHNLGMATEPYRLYYRTAGISDNSGTWTLLPGNGDMSGAAGAPYVQFMIEFRVAGLTCIPARIHNVGVVYDSDDSLPAELRWHLGDSDNSNGTVGFSQTDVFSSLATLTITYYRADTDAAVLVQSSDSTTNGEFEYWNGSAWADGLGSNAVGTRRRFVPSAGLPVGVDVYAKIVAA